MSNILQTTVQDGRVRPRALGGDERCKEQICIEANRLENAARAVRDMATEEEPDPTRSCNDEMLLKDKAIPMKWHNFSSLKILLNSGGDGENHQRILKMV